MSAPKPPVDVANDQATEAWMKFRAEQQRQHDNELAESKAEAARTGKEPFSREKVQALWQPERWPGDEIAEAEWHDIEEDYYMQRGRFQTIARYIPYLKTLEEWREPLMPTGWKEELAALFPEVPGNQSRNDGGSSE